MAWRQANEAAWTGEQVSMTGAYVKEGERETERSRSQSPDPGCGEDIGIYSKATGSYRTALSRRSPRRYFWFGVKKGSKEFSASRFLGFGIGVTPSPPVVK
jgi:hypothetical protein